jgi:transcriptional regulator with GAF, ATPase, and Fis domain
VEQTLAVVFERQDSRNLAERHRTAARELWERTAATLPQHLKEGFWRHPARKGLAEPERGLTAKERPRSPSAREKNLERLLDINKKLNSSLDTKVVLNYTIDSAIELTESERGFVILRSRVEGGGGGEGELSVAVARRMDHETIGKSLKYSRRVVDQVIRTGKPLITDSAQEDTNFSSSYSVHELRLQSIIGLPIHSAGAVIGALCLDHRSRRGLFTQEVKDLLAAFADQVAIALTNARLHAEIARRNEELQEKQARIEELLRGKEAEIDRKDEEIGRLKGLAKEPPRSYRHDYSTIIGRGPAMCAVLDKLDRVIDTKIDVLIQGESGTGKELIANAIHANGPHKRGEIVAFNCSSVPENLIEGELFGAKRGSYTGLDHDKPGLIMGAHKGTLFLDEIGEMPLKAQATLLRVLQERKVRPLGHRKEIPIDFRLVCATNRSLEDEVAEGRFREDLYWRIKGHLIELPPLRERREDIPELARHILEREAPGLHRRAPKLTPEALRLLIEHPWSGNVRALEHVLKNAICMADGDTLTPAHLDLPKVGVRSSRPFSREDEEARLIRAALQRHRYVTDACEELKMPRATFYRKLHRYGIRSPEDERGSGAEPSGGRPRAPAKGRRRPRPS